ncbi:MAG: response regulator transcription factor [Bacteroidaceae bacterium]|nr:response regulator transcription factor [Bacteroidaceae bacterium]
MKRILVVDDEPDLCDILRFNLQAAGYEVETARSAEEALNKNLTEFDLLLLDVMLGGMSGFDLAHQLKANPQTAHLPIIFLTALDSEENTLQGFRLGADDYVTKPFSIREVLARVKAVLTRAATAETPQTLSYEGLTMNHTDRSVNIDGTDVPFTRTEFDLLWTLLSQRGKVFSRQELIDQAWPPGVIVTDRTVDVNITRVRKKVGRYALCIVTRQGYGYYFCLS